MQTIAPQCTKGGAQGKRAHPWSMPTDLSNCEHFPKEQILNKPEVWVK